MRFPMQASRRKSESAWRLEPTGWPTCTYGGSDPCHYGVVAAIVSDTPQAPEAYKARLSGLDALSHVTVEVHACRH